MRNDIKDLLRWILSSFDNNTKGASARKLTAFWVLIILVTGTRAIWLLWAWRHNDFTALQAINAADYALISICLGLTTYQRIKKRQDESDKDKSE